VAEERFAGTNNPSAVHGDDSGSSELVTMIERAEQGVNGNEGRGRVCKKNDGIRELG
jgi:hypothetical protein